MSVMGSQLEIDLDPEGSETVVPRHTGQTGTGCFHLHDHSILETTLDGGRQGPLFVSHLSTAAAMDAEGRTNHIMPLKASKILQKNAYHSRNLCLVC